MKTYLRLGDWNAICDECGRKFKASQLKKRWDGFMVCEEDWEPRHPQDFVRGVPDNTPLPFTRPEPADTFIAVTYTVLEYTCSPTSRYSQADLGTADCMTVSVINMSV